MKKRVLFNTILFFYITVAIIILLVNLVADAWDKNPDSDTSGATPSITSLFMPKEKSSIAVHSSIPYWQEDAFDSVKLHPEKFQTVSMFWYYINSDLDIATYEYARVDESLIAYAHDHDIKVLALIANLPDEDGSEWSSDRIRPLIENSVARSKHINDLIALVEEKNFDGLNIDYEELDDDLKNDYSTFIKELSEEMHKRGKIVGVAIHPKSGNNIPSEDNGSRAQDWVALSKSADQLYFMTHGEHWDASEAGPPASIPWDKEIIDYAKKLDIPMEKIYLGIPLYAMRWEEGEKGDGEGLLYRDVAQLMDQHNVKPIWDVYSETPYIRYEEDGTDYEVWFDNAESVKAKIELAKENKLGGISFWHLGGEDPEIWNEVK